MSKWVAHPVRLARRRGLAGLYLGSKFGSCLTLNFLSCVHPWTQFFKELGAQHRIETYLIVLSGSFPCDIFDSDRKIVREDRLRIRQAVCLLTAGIGLYSGGVSCQGSFRLRTATMVQRSFLMTAVTALRCRPPSVRIEMCSRSLSWDG